MMSLRDAVLVFFFMASQLHCCHGSTWISTKFVDYSNSAGRLYTGECCEPTGSTCRDECQYTFTFCLGDESEDPTCSGDMMTSFDLPSANDVTFEEPIIEGHQINPQAYKVDSYGGSIGVKMIVEHRSSTDPDVIELVDVLTGVIDVDTAASEDAATPEALVLTGSRPTDVTEGPEDTNEQTVMNLEVAAYCDDNFFGEDCDEYCVPTDNCNGHYTCAEGSGDKVCNDGWEGNDCSVRISGSNECEVNPGALVCENGGTCIDFEDGTQECCCPDEYEGETCGTARDPCESAPCANGGTCTSDETEYTCTCRLGYYGTTCEMFAAPIECSDDITAENAAAYDCAACPNAGPCAAQVPAPCAEGEDCDNVGSTMESTEGTTEGITPSGETSIESSELSSLFTDLTSGGDTTAVTENPGASTVDEEDRTTLSPEELELALILDRLLPELPDGVDRELLLADLLELLRAGALSFEDVLMRAGALAAEDELDCATVLSQVRVVPQTIVDPVTKESKTVFRLLVPPSLQNLDIDILQFILECTNQQLPDDLQVSEVEDPNTLLLDSKRFEFNLVGEYSDMTTLETIASAIQTLYEDTHPELAGCEIVIPRTEELVGTIGDKGTKLLFWIKLDGEVLDANEYQIQESTEVIAAINTNTELEIQGFDVSAEEIFNINAAHSIFVEGQAYNEDLSQFQVVLESFFASVSATYTVKMVPRIEPFFLAATGSLVSAVSYELYTVAGNPVLPAQVNAQIPTEEDLTSLITFESSGGGTYTLETTARATLDMASHATSSSTTLVKKTECMQVVVEGVFVQETSASFQTALSGSISSLGADVSVSSVIVAGSEEVIVEGKVSTAVYFALESESGIVDARQYASVAPPVEDLNTAIEEADITKPDGSTYTMVANATAIETSIVKEDCLVFYAEGAVTQLSEELSTQLKTSLLQERTDLAEFESSLEIQVQIREESVAAEVGSVTAVYYTASVQAASGATVMLSAKSQATLEVSTSVLQENLVSAEGEAMFSFVSPENTTVLPRDKLFTVSSSASVLKTHYADFEASVQSMVETKLGASVSIQTMVQEVTKTVTGESFFQLGFSITSESETTITTESFSAVTSEDIENIEVTSSTGESYSLVSDMTTLEETLRVDTMFTVPLMTPPSLTQTAELEATILLSWQETETSLFESSTEASVTIVAVTEKLTSEMTTVFEVQYSLSVDNVQISATQHSAVSIEVVAEKLATVTNPQGVAYEVNTNITVSASAELTSTEFTWPVVMSRNVLDADKESFIEGYTTYVSTLMEVESSSLSVTMVKQQEIISSTTFESQWSVEMSVSLDGQLVTQSAAPEIVTADLTAALPEPTAGASFSVLATTVEETVSYEAAFSTTFSSVILEEHVATVMEVIEETYAEMDSSITATYVSSEEIIDITTGTTFFNLNFMLSAEVSGVTRTLDARVDAFVEATSVTTALAELDIKGSVGAYAAVEVSRNVESSSETSINVTSIVRVSETVSITVDGAVAEADKETFAAVMQSAISTQMSNVGVTLDVEVTAVQTQQMFSLDTSVTSTSSTSTTIVLLASSSSTTSTTTTAITTASIGELETEIIQAEIEAQTFVGEVSYTAVTDTSTLVSKSDTIEMTFDVAVTDQTIVELQEKFQTTLMERSEFTEEVTVTVVNREERLTTASSVNLQASSSYTVSFAVSSSVSSTVISSTSFSALTSVELESCLDVSISADSSSTFLQHLAVTADASIETAVTIDIEASVSVEQTHGLTLTAPIVPAQRIEMQTAMSTSITAEMGFEVAVEIVAVRSSFDITTKQEVFTVQYTTTSVESSTMLTAVDLPTLVDLDVTAQFEAQGIVSATGTAYAMVSLSTSEVLVTESLYTSTSTKIIQQSDIAGVQLAFQSSFIATMGFEADVDMSVTYAQSRPIVTASGSIVYENQFAIAVEGVTLDSRVTGLISKTELNTSLAAVEVTGTSMTYSDLVVDVDIDVDVEASVELEYNSLVGVYLESNIDVELRSEFELSIATTMAAQLEISVEELSVSIASTEVVISAGVEVHKCLVSVMQAGFQLDARVMPELDLDLLTTEISLNAELSAAVSIKTDVSIESTFRLEEAVNFYLETSELTDLDVEIVLAELQAEFRLEFGASVELELATFGSFFSDLGGGTAISVFVKNEGVLMTQSLSISSMTSVTTALSTQVSASGFAFSFTFPSVSTSFTLARQTFGFFSSVKFQSVDIEIIQTAIAAEWSATYSGVSVKIFDFQTFFTASGEKHYRCAFGGFLGSVALSSDFAISLSSLEIRDVFVSISSQTSVDYSLSIDVSSSLSVVSQADLGFLVCSRPIVVSQYSEFALELQQSYQAAFGVSVNIEVIGQEEVVMQVGSVFKTVTRLLYSITDESGVTITAPNFDASFHAEVSASISTNVALSSYTLISSTATTFVSQSSLFSFYTAEPCLEVDLLSLAASIALQYSATATVEIQQQVEVKFFNAISGQWESRWELVYSVFDGGVYLDAEVTTALTDVQISTAFSSVTITGTTLSYSSITVAQAEVTSVVQSSSLFSFVMSANIEVSMYARIALSLQAECRVQLGISDAIVTVTGVREIMLATGEFAYELMYSIQSAGVAINSQTSVSLSTSSVQTIISTVTQSRVSVLEVDITTVKTIENSFSFYVSAMVADVDNILFVEALQARYTNYTVVFGVQDFYLFNGQYVTQMNYYLEIEGVFVNPMTLIAFTIEELTLAFDFTLTSGASFTLIAEADVTSLVRVSNAFTLAIAVPIAPGHIELVQNNLLIEWQRVVAEASACVISRQDMAITSTGEVVYNIMYSVNSSTEISITSTTHTSITIQSIQTALQIEVSAGVFYSASLITEEVSIMSITSLFSITLDQQLAQYNFIDLQTSLMTVWSENTEVAVSTLTVLSQTQVVSITGEISWAIYYEVQTANETLVSKDYVDIFSVEVLQAALTFQSSLGISYTALEVSTTYISLSSAFSLYMSVQIVETDLVIITEQLQTAWITFTEDTSIVINTTFIEEEFDAFGASVFKLGYFVESSLDVTFDARFDVSVSMTEITTILQDITIAGSTQTYSEVLFTGDVSTLVQASTLVPVIMTTKVTQESYTELISIATATWSTIEGLADIEVSISSQQSVSFESSLYSTLYFSISAGTKVFSLADVSSVSADLDFSSVTNLEGEAYQIASEVSVLEVRRLRMAQSVYLSTWVAKTDVETFIEAVATTLSASVEFSATLSVEFAQQLEVVIDGVIQYQFSYFILDSTTVIDAQTIESIQIETLQTNLATVSLETYQVQVVSHTQIISNIDLSYKLQIQGSVAEVDLEAFSVSLQELYTAEFELNVTVTAAGLSLEAIGEGGAIVSEVLYQLSVEGGHVLDPAITPGLSMDVMSSLAVESSVGVVYELYEGTTIRYDQQYQIAFSGQVDETVAVQAIDLVQALWETTLEGSIMVNLTKVETIFGAFGVQKTRVLYSVSVDGMATFPNNDPSPTEEEITTSLATLTSVQVTTQVGLQVELMRSDLMFEVTLQGELTTEVVQTEVQAALTTTWSSALAGVASAEIVIGGTVAVTLPTDPTAIANKVLYYIKTENTTLVAAELAVPTEAEISTGLSVVSSVQVVTSVTQVLTTYQKTFTGVFSEARLEELQVGLAAAWTTAGGAAAEVIISTHQTQFSATWEQVTTVSYSVTIGGVDVSSMVDVAPPSDEDLTAELGDELAPCGCTALLMNSVYLSAAAEAGGAGALAGHEDGGDAQSEDEEALVTAVAQAYADVNEGMEADQFNITVRTRPFEDGEQVTDANGTELSALEFTVSFDSSDPNPAFITVPSTAEIEAALEAAGVSPCGCEPAMCTSVELDGEVEDIDDLCGGISSDITDAVVHDNPGLSPENVTVEVKSVEVADDGSTSTVSYCIQYNGDNGLSAVNFPSSETIQEVATNNSAGEDGILYECIPPTTTLAPPELIELATYITDRLFLGTSPDDDVYQSTLLHIINVLKAVEAGGLAAGETPPINDLCIEVLNRIQVHVETVLDLNTRTERVAMTLYAPADLLDDLAGLDMDVAVFAYECANTILEGSTHQLSTIDDASQVLSHHKRYELKLIGTHLEDTFADGVKSVIQNSFSRAYSELRNPYVEILRADEATTYPGTKVTVFSFWMRDEDSDSSIIDPQAYPFYFAGDVVSSMRESYPQVELTLYELSDTVYTYSSTHFLLVEGVVYEEDKAQFEEAIQSYYSTVYTGYTALLLPHTIMYHDLATSSSSFSVSKLMYVVYTGEGEQALPTHANFAAPTEQQFDPYITFTTVLGSSYRLHMTGRSSIDVTTQQTLPEGNLHRKDESLVLFIDDTVQESDGASITNELKQLSFFRDQDALITYIASEEVIIGRYSLKEDYMGSAAALYFGVHTTAGTTIDMRHRPQVQPVGITWRWFNINQQEYYIAPRATCYHFYVQEGIKAQEKHEIEQQLLTIALPVIEALPLSHRATDPTVKIVSREEYVQRNVGIVSAVYYQILDGSDHKAATSYDASRLPSLKPTTENLAQVLPQYSIIPADSDDLIRLTDLASLPLVGPPPRELDDVTAKLSACYQQHSDLAVVGAGVTVETDTFERETGTAVLYELRKPDGSLATPNPSTVLTPADIQTCLDDQWSTGAPVYETYSGTSVSWYHHYYQVVLAGDVDSQVAQNVVHSLNREWTTRVHENAKIVYEKQELHFGTYGSVVTKVLYTAYVENESDVKLPRFYQPLDLPAVQAAVSRVPDAQLIVVPDSVQLHRFQELGTAVLQGNITSDVLDMWSDQVSESYGGEGINIEVAGSTAASSVTDPQSLSHRVYYTVSTPDYVLYANEMQSHDLSITSLPQQGVRVVEEGLQTEVYDLVLEGVVMDYDGLIRDLSDAWDSHAYNNSGTFYIVNVEQHITSTGSFATKIQYTAPHSTLMSHSMPHIMQELGSLYAVCTNCITASLTTVYLYGTGHDGARLSNDVRNVCLNINDATGLQASDLQVDVVMTSSSGRQRRAAGERDVIYDRAGERVTPAHLTVQHMGQDVNPLFVRTPTERQLRDQLTARGYVVCSPESGNACAVRRCSELVVDALVEDTQESRDALTSDIRVALLDINHAVLKGNLNVDLIGEFVYERNSNSEDTTTRISYCFYHDGESDVISYLALPESNDMSISSSSEDQDDSLDTTKIVIIIVVVSVVVAVVIVTLVVVKVCCRNRPRCGGDTGSQTHSIRTGSTLDDDDEEFTGHAPYQSSVFRTNEIEAIKNKLH